MRLTKVQRAWLEKLRDEGVVAKRPPSSTGKRCMQSGWSDWAMLDEATGEEISGDEWLARFRGGQPGTANIKVIGERITEAGRRALEEQNDE